MRVLCFRVHLLVHHQCDVLTGFPGLSMSFVIAAFLRFTCIAINYVTGLNVRKQLMSCKGAGIPASQDTAVVDACLGNIY